MRSSSTERRATRRGFLPVGAGAWLRLALVVALGGAAVAAPTLDRTGAVYTDTETFDFTVGYPAPDPTPTAEPTATADPTATAEPAASSDPAALGLTADPAASPDPTPGASLGPSPTPSPDPTGGPRGWWRDRPHR